MNDMQVKYPKKMPSVCWDPVQIEYPTRKFPSTNRSSETVGHSWRTAPEVLFGPRLRFTEEVEYQNDCVARNNLYKSETTVSYGAKLPETRRFNKHTSLLENKYMYPLSRRLAERVPAERAHGTSEMRSSYQIFPISSRLVTVTDQFKNQASLPENPPPTDPVSRPVEALDTTHEGFEKLLDPYLTTSRLHHRPFTADQLARPTNSRDIVTYYTLGDTTWAWSPKPKSDEWRLPAKRPQSVYDREKFKDGFREIRTHNKLAWVPGSFRTEKRDNFTTPFSKPGAQIRNDEKYVRSHYQRSVANLSTNTADEDRAMADEYSTENRHVGAGRPLCSVLDQFKERNKRVERIIRKAVCDSQKY